MILPLKTANRASAVPAAQRRDYVRQRTETNAGMAYLMLVVGGRDAHVSGFRKTVKRNSHEVFDGVFSATTRITEFHSNEETMSIGRLSILSLAMAGCAAAAYAIGRHARKVEKRQHKEDLRTWEDEGGNLAPSETPDIARPAAAA